MSASTSTLTDLTSDRKTKIAFANEGAEKAKAEADVVNRKRKIEEQAKWEGEFTCPHDPKRAQC